MQKSQLTAYVTGSANGARFLAKKKSHFEVSIGRITYL